MEFCLFAFESQDLNVELRNTTVGELEISIQIFLVLLERSDLAVQRLDLRFELFDPAERIFQGRVEFVLELSERFDLLIGLFYLAV